MESHLQALIGYFSEHPQWALAAVFAAALLESLAVIGTVVPGSSIVFVGGVLVGLQALDPASVAIAAVCGAIAGDGISYWLGRRHRDRIRALWPMKAYPALFDRGQAYFAKMVARAFFLRAFSARCELSYRLSPACRAYQLRSSTCSTFCRRWCGRRLTSLPVFSSVHRFSWPEP
ncbi:DedA family protein [Variovorax paradoxus]|uniref:DedA family protein n=1 Tax=Variovorax paradoxus TaxID=34073 RepID=UPI00068849F7|nr:hypothetical protein [Variovorax paradoxus]